MHIEECILYARFTRWVDGGSSLIRLARVDVPSVARALTPGCIASAVAAASRGFGRMVKVIVYAPLPGERRHLVYVGFDPVREVARAEVIAHSIGALAAPMVSSWWELSGARLSRRVAGVTLTAKPACNAYMCFAAAYARLQGSPDVLDRLVPRLAAEAERLANELYERLHRGWDTRF